MTNYEILNRDCDSGQACGVSPPCPPDKKCYLENLNNELADPGFDIPEEGVCVRGLCHAINTSDCPFFELLGEASSALVGA